MNREDARAYVKKNGPLPEQPALEGRQCLHAESPRPCSCHLTVEQQGVAAELGDYTLYLFGLPHRGRVKVPYCPAADGPRPAPQVHVAPEASEATTTHVAPAAPASPSVSRPAKRAFDPVYNSAYAKARRRGPEAVAAFKAEWAAKKAAA